ncbi:MAG: urea ABC transporter substrate-binding protein, partial [Candidatus Rokuibacteriota bacterium]
MELTRRDLLKGAAAATAGAATFRAPSIFVRRLTQASAQDNTIKVGILHSLSGTIAIIERSLHNAELLAIEEINAKGGVLGKKIEPIVEDPKSEVRFFKEKAEKLILRDKV